jgi:hypothetical protein
MELIIASLVADIHRHRRPLAVRRVSAVAKAVLIRYSTAIGRSDWCSPN